MLKHVIVPNNGQLSLIEVGNMAFRLGYRFFAFDGHVNFVVDEWTYMATGVELDELTV